VTKYSQNYEISFTTRSNDMSFDSENHSPGAKIKVIGVGGGGGNAVNTMIRSKIDSVDFICANTDVQSLKAALAPTKIQIGKDLTKGLGAGSNPDVGRDAALENRTELNDALLGADMVFITAGMGGGTGTGAAAIAAKIAKERGALTVAVVTKPFLFEGKRRQKNAEIGIERLREQVDNLLVIPNEQLLRLATPNLTMLDAFKMADNILVNAVRGISDIINVPGTINVDFADVRAVMAGMGQSMMGIGFASGENRAVKAAQAAICSPLLEDLDIEGASGILINISANSQVTLMEISAACAIVQDAAHEDANIIFGTVIDETLNEEIRVTVIATGFPAEGAANFNVKNTASQRLVHGAQSERTVRASFMPSQAASMPQMPTAPVVQPAMPAAPIAQPAVVAHQIAVPQAAAPQASAAPQFVAPQTVAPQPTGPQVAAQLQPEAAPFPAALQPQVQAIAPQVQATPASLAAQPAAPQVVFQAPSNPISMNTAPAATTASSMPFIAPTPVLQAITAISQQTAAENEASTQQELDRKIDEAVELASNVNQLKGTDDNLDVPTFLRETPPALNLP
jgi:cell division protein FtsZ